MSGGWPVAPPMRIVTEGWFGLYRRQLTLLEAEAYWLRKAAESVGDDKAKARFLVEAERNWTWRQATHPPMPDCPRCEGSGIYDRARPKQPPCPCRFRVIDSSSELMKGMTVKL